MLFNNKEGRCDECIFFTPIESTTSRKIGKCHYHPAHPDHGFPVVKTDDYCSFGLLEVK